MLLKMSISSSILIILTIILRFFAINRLPKKVFVLLWNIVILRLLVPFYLPIRYGITSPMEKMMDSSVSHYNVVNRPVITGISKDPIDDTVTLSLSGVTWTTIVWVAGMVILLVVFGVLYWKEYQKIQAGLPVSKETDHYFRSVAAVPNRVKFLVSDRITTPLTLGVLSPKIIFPKIFKLSDNTKIKYVLTHELIHIKRLDTLWKIVILIVVSVHWFNPFVWIMYGLFNRDVELSCDEKVITLFGETTKKEYVMTLVDLAEKQSCWSFISNGFGKNAIQERVVAIMKFKKATCISIGCMVFLLAGAITVFAQNDFKATVNDISVTSEVRSTEGNKNHVEKAESIHGEYLKHGITIIDEAYYYQGVRIRIFMDLRENKSFETFNFDNAGTVDVRLVRSEDNSIKKIEYLTEEEANEILSDFDEHDSDEYDSAEQTNDQHVGVISRLTKEELPNKVKDVINSCDDEKWYMIGDTEYQYIYFNDLPANYSFQPEIYADSHCGILSIFDMGTTTGNYVLPEIERNISLKIFYNHSQVVCT
ncbi:M56 family metallopeptidase [Lachnospiraceae bacterium 45-W7]